MAQYKLRFFFAELDEARRFCEVQCSAGHLGMALNRAWKNVKIQPAYKDIKGLRPTTIEIAPPEKVAPKKQLRIWESKVKVGV